MGSRRRKFDGAFNSRAARGLKTVSELASLHQVHSMPLALWKTHLLDGAAGVLDASGPGKPASQEPAAAELYEQLGG
jgi:transposase